eukprot:TRINITY_DN13443_c0_g1_i1.p1 TRINITY_DN13443_c0_g1~~TRINITY_DN13443_c0_g1_i1.p1  ORF type:complete len:360 (+),score=75.69 TRINITY_DN13443_c0_g1_i1:63-1082(+)
MYDLVIIGGGLSSLIVAYEYLLHSLGSVVVLEAAAQVGGRLQMTEDGIDVGAAWVWERDNPLTMDLLKKLSLKTMTQPGTHPSMRQSRVIGGAASITKNLSDIISNSNSAGSSNLGIIKTQTEVTKVTLDVKTGQITTTTRDGSKYLSKRVVVGAPPRIAAKITFTPEISREKQKASRDTPAWMSKVGKVVLRFPDKWWSVYETFGSLPVEGPGFQIYDASTTKVNALVIFCQSPTGVSESTLKQLVVQQLVQSFGTKAGTPTGVDLTLWSRNPHINENPSDFKMFHLSPNENLSSPEWNSKLLFAGSEAAKRHPGFIEGAVESAYDVMTSLHSQCSAN